MVRGFLCAVLLLTGCVELGVVTDGTSISVGKASHGYLVDAARLPDKGEGYMTREIWLQRDNRYGTDELVELITGVARRLAPQMKGTRLVIADMSSRRGGGGRENSAFHRSHQSGRDADLLYYMRDAEGQPFEADAMHQFDGRGRTHDGSGITLDVPRTWLLVKELVAAPEAPVQFIFMYEPVARLLLDHAAQIGEPPAVIAKARLALKQPGDSARHDDHMHVRVYCSKADREFGCVDMGPMELLAEREAEHSQLLELVGQVVTHGDTTKTAGTLHPTGQVMGASAAASLGARADRIDLRGWR
ncbi:MAG TPA: penicillin-insensitive murein endopeptidase [Kofleriaceae bacterium]